MLELTRQMQELGEYVDCQVDRSLSAVPGKRRVAISYISPNFQKQTTG